MQEIWSRPDEYEINCKTTEALTPNSLHKFLEQASVHSEAFFLKHSVSSQIFSPEKNDNISTCSSSSREQREVQCRANCQRRGAGGHLSIRYCISNKGLKGADKKGLRPDTISDIISALCIPLNNDSISTRTAHLFIPLFLCTMNVRKRDFFFFFLLSLARDNF